MSAQAKPPARPVRRYTSDGHPIRTGHTIGSAAHRIAPDTERVRALSAHVEQQRKLDESDKDLTLRFTEAFDGSSAGAGATNLLEQAEGEFTGAIVATKARAAAVVEDSKLTASERQAKATATALADVLTERGLVTPPPSPVAADELEELDAPEEPESDGDQLYGWYDEAEKRYYAQDKNGYFLKDENDHYVTYDDVVPEDELSEGDEVIGYLEETSDDEWETLDAA
jgi:hypothetical protein